MDTPAQESGGLRRMPHVWAVAVMRALQGSLLLQPHLPDQALAPAQEQLRPAGAGNACGC